MIYRWFVDLWMICGFMESTKHVRKRSQIIRTSSVNQEKPYRKVNQEIFGQISNKQHTIKHPMKHLAYTKQHNFPAGGVRDFWNRAAAAWWHHAPSVAYPQFHGTAAHDGWWLVEHPTPKGVGCDQNPWKFDFPWISEENVKNLEVARFSWPEFTSLVVGHAVSSAITAAIWEANAVDRGHSEVGVSHLLPQDGETGTPPPVNHTSLQLVLWQTLVNSFPLVN